MKNFSSWLIAMFAFMFWGFRLVGTVMSTLGFDFMFEPSNMVMEVFLLFVTFITICFIIKRRLWASLIYLIGHLLYYIPTFITHFTGVINGTLDMNGYIELLFELIGIALPLAAIFDVLLDKNK